MDAVEVQVMRAFVALELPPDAVRQMERVVASLKGTLDLHAAVWTKIRWVRPSQAHLTLRFLGEVSDHQIETVINDLGGELQSWGESLNLRFGHGGAFPSPARARVLWLALDGSLSRLSEIAGLAERAARKSGLEPSSREFRPHVTLARIQPPMNASGLLASLRTDKQDWQGGVISVIRSDLRPMGPEYTALAQFDLSRVHVAN